MAKIFKLDFLISFLSPHGSLRYIQEIYGPFYELSYGNPKTTLGIFLLAQSCDATHQPYNTKIDFFAQLCDAMW